MKSKSTLLFLSILLLALVISLPAAQAQTSDLNDEEPRLDGTIDVGMPIGSEFESDDMNDRFATEIFVPFARGRVITATSQTGDVEVLKVLVRHLEPNHDYQVMVLIQPNSCGFNPACLSFVATDSIQSGPAGQLQAHNVSVGALDPDLYRLDIFVTHNHPTVPASGGPVIQLISALLNRDLLLACQPAPRVLVN